MNYAKYRLQSYHEIEAYQDKAGERFDNFFKAVYNVLLKMKAGDEYCFTKHVKEENREMFVKVACLFISEGNYDYTFNEEFTIIKREYPLIIEPKKDKK